MVDSDRLDFWYKNNRNVLFVGKHGVGKTSIIKGCFERNGLKHGENYLYFSASTLDPWVDLVGVPKESNLEDGTPCLKLIRPAALATGKVVAIFFDEFNRSPKKVRNAVMELLQFRSINGMEFPNLKVIWAAINPDDEEVYDVEKIDPAQKDRFHIIKEVEYKPNKDWFVKRFGIETATSAIEWWQELPEEEKDKVTPRRLEYALDEFERGGYINDVLPVSCGVNKLVQSLRNGPIQNKILELFESKNIIPAKAFLSNDSNLNSSIKYITANKAYLEFFLPLMPKEKIVSLMSENDIVCRHIASNGATNDLFYKIMRDIVEANQDEKLVRKLRRYVVMQSPIDVKDTPAKEPEKVFYNKKGNNIDFKKFMMVKFNNNEEREDAFDAIRSNISKDISCEEAEYILQGLSNITHDMWVTSILNPKFDKIIGIVNHCLNTIKQHNDEMDILVYIMNKYSCVTSFFRKLQQANLFEKVVRI